MTCPSYGIGGERGKERGRGKKKKNRDNERKRLSKKSATKFTNNYYNFFTPRCNRKKVNKKKQNVDSVGALDIEIQFF